MPLETRPGSLDDLGHVYKRRGSDERLQHIADSAVLKIMQYAVTAVAVPLLGWGMSAVLDRMASIERSIQQNDTTTATYKLRLETLEKASLERDITIRLLTEKVIGHDYELKSLAKQPR